MKCMVVLGWQICVHIFRIPHSQTAENGLAIAMNFRKKEKDARNSQNERERGNTHTDKPTYEIARLILYETVVSLFSR